MRYFLINLSGELICILVSKHVGGKTMWHNQAHSQGIRKIVDYRKEGKSTTMAKMTEGDFF